MHEASIVREILDVAGARAGAARVLQIRVQVGQLSGVSPDALAFYFEILRSDTVGPQAELEVALVPLRGRCVACGGAVDLPELTWSCPQCTGALVFDNGTELSLTSLVVEPWVR
jgi:hydrogenase nickel incorporation protein HypA/HybF